VSIKEHFFHKTEHTIIWERSWIYPLYMKWPISCWLADFLLLLFRLALSLFNHLHLMAVHVQIQSINPSVYVYNVIPWLRSNPLKFGQVYRKCQHLQHQISTTKSIINIFSIIYLLDIAYVLVLFMNLVRLKHV
jgi:hypothetical protein